MFFFFFQFNFLKLTNEVRQVIQAKLVLACGEDSLYCDIADMEAVCSDILDDNNGNGSSSSLEEDLPDNHHLRQKRQAQIKSRHQKRIQIFFNMLSKASWFFFTLLFFLVVFFILQYICIRFFLCYLKKQTKKCPNNGNIIGFWGENAVEKIWRCKGTYFSKMSLVFPRPKNNSQDYGNIISSYGFLRVCIKNGLVFAHSINFLNWKKLCSTPKSSSSNCVKVHIQFFPL